MSGIDEQVIDFRVRSDIGYASRGAGAQAGPLFLDREIFQYRESLSGDAVEFFAGRIGGFLDEAGFFDGADRAPGVHRAGWTGC